MTQNTIKILATTIVALALAALALQNLNQGSTQSSDLLLPDFRATANNVTQIDLEWAADDSRLTLTRSDDNWTLAQRNNYAVDIALVRQLIVALADATIVEEKTSNSELYTRLGVADVSAGGRGTSVNIEDSDGNSFSLLLGDQAQGRYRYARVSGQETSYLINQNPDIPEQAGDWLVKDILDIGAGDVQQVSIAHSDGEVISAEKSSRDQTDFVVLDIPENRELSYATVANGIAGALRSLTLDDVRPTTPGAPAVTTRFQTWSGATVVATLTEEGDQTWIEFAVTETEAISDAASEGPEAETDGAENPIDVDMLNARLSGWQYQVASNKKNLLSRRWEDILKSIDDE